MGISEFDEAYLEDEAEIRGAILTEPISHIAKRKPVEVSPDTPLRDAVRLMNRHHRRCALVVENARLVGILSERDLLRLADGGLPIDSGLQVGQVMTRDPEVLRPDHTIALALNKMSEGGYRHVPLVDSQGRPAGLIAMRDIVAFIVSLFPDRVLTAPPDPTKIPERYGG